MTLILSKDLTVVKSSSEELIVVREEMLENRDAHTRTAVLAPYFRTFRTEYKEYGARRPSYLGSTDFSTGYGHFYQHGVRGVRSTKSTKVRMSIPAREEQ